MQGFLTLRECINAETSYRLLVSEYFQEREVIISGHYPAYETKYGTIQQETISTENAAIYMIEAEQRMKRQIEPLQDKRELLQSALVKLTHREREAFNSIVWGDHTDIDKQELKHLEHQITQKLCSYLQELT